MRPVLLASVAQKDYEKWAQSNVKVFGKINELITDIDLHPYSGLGKPEPLKHELAGFGRGASRLKTVWFTKYLRKTKLLLSVAKGITVRRVKTLLPSGHVYKGESL